MTAQDVMKHRLGTNLDRLEAVIAQNSAAIARNADAIAKPTDGMMVMQAATKALTEVVEGYEGRLQGHDEQSQIMQAAMTNVFDCLHLVAEHDRHLQTMEAAMTALFERMDRFIRGLETDGQKSRGERRTDGRASRLTRRTSTRGH